MAVPAVERLLPSLGGVDKVEALLVLGLWHVKAQTLDAAEAAAREIDHLAAHEPMAQGAAGVLRATAAAREGTARADRLMNEALTLLPEQKPPCLNERLLAAQAEIKQSMGKLDAAVALNQQAVALADKACAPWRRAHARSSLAYSLTLARQPVHALSVSQEAVGIARAAGDLLEQSRVMTVESIILSELGRSQEELQASEAAISLARQAGARRDEALATANLADSYLQRQDYATALRLAQQALPMAREIRDHSSEVVALANAGLALIGLGRHREGVALMHEAMGLEERAGNLTKLAGMHQELGAMLEKAGQLAPAWASLSEHRRLAGQLFQRQHQQSVLELQEAFEADRRQRELAALQTETGIQEARLTQRDLQRRLWAAAVAAGLLLLAVVGVLVHRMRRSNAQLLGSNAQLQVAGERDPLTGLANRRHLLNAMQRSDGTGAGFEGSMLLIDVDHFKRINDEQGHAAGDAVLVEISSRLLSVLRESDLSVRWGGEEFLIVVRGMAATEVQALAQRLLQVIGGRKVFLQGKELAVTASIGFATFPLPRAEQATAQALNWERAIALVDTAMYLAKSQGRNRAYGVKTLNESDPAQDAAQLATLESAWRNGRAELTELAGPVPVAS